MAAAAETGQAVAPSGKRRRGHRRSASDPRTPERLAAGPWLPGALTCPERTRGDAATRSARPPVLPPPPRPPQRRCRHLVSRAGTPRCACAGTASEGPRRCRAAILIAGQGLAKSSGRPRKSAQREVQLLGAPRPAPCRVLGEGRADSLAPPPASRLPPAASLN
uniref:putative uncharacterized protein FLJ40606 n=1 Tax=Nyctereutes procyonoides TaxID=34880 RepID=UPI0024453378|nr:putative uncharacterized protein FLJ40606 [Nyctereutes procyonoides]